MPIFKSKIDRWINGPPSEATLVEPEFRTSLRGSSDRNFILRTASSDNLLLATPELCSIPSSTVVPRPAAQTLTIVTLGLEPIQQAGRSTAEGYASLARALKSRGHRVSALQWAPGTIPRRTKSAQAFAKPARYTTLDDLKDRFSDMVQKADLVIVGAGIQDGVAVGEWVTRTAHGATIFYDLDASLTISKLKNRQLDQLSAALLERYDLYLSFSGGPSLEQIQTRYGSPMARPLYAAVDPELYFPETTSKKWSLGYLGDYDENRQPALDEMFLGPAREWKQGKFSLAGQGYPKQVCWTPNVECLDRLSSPVQRRRFYNSQGFSLNVSAADCDEGNLCPSTGLFEAAACGTPAISDYWEGLEQFFQPGEDILVASCGEESLCYLLAFSDEERDRMGKRARSRVLAKHSIQQRALQLETYAQEILKFSRTSHD